MRADSREQAMAILIPLLPRSMGADTLSPLELEEMMRYLDHDGLCWWWREERQGVNDGWNQARGEKMERGLDNCHRDHGNND